MPNENNTSPANQTAAPVGSTNGSALSFEGMYALENMVRAAVIRATPRCYGTAPRWVAVAAYFSRPTTSAQLCKHFGLDPHEEIEGWPQPDTDEQNTAVRGEGRDSTTENP